MGNNASSKSLFAHSALAVSTNVAELDGDVEARAMQLYQTKKYQQAAEAFTEAIDKYSDALHHPHLLAALLTNRAACNKRCGKLKSAMDDCQHAITANPSCLRAFAILHKIRRALGLPTTDEYISEAWGAA
ncbi:hypothetical protein PPROV_000483100 [Pycnococcus provasolii]|uniref:Uncharacterized protein n=1 Tax=Pycnococcus provasolii TaxID=41880 RepID=A0A830HG52_9CHLO|nr:hypothetical protein PPROV_000483100 [Pycnococcus provasolii]